MGCGDRSHLALLLLLLGLRFRVKLCRQAGCCAVPNKLLRGGGGWGLRQVRGRAARRQRFNQRRASGAQPTCTQARLTSLAGAGAAGEGWLLGPGWAGSGGSMGARPSLPAVSITLDSAAGC